MCILRNPEDVKKTEGHMGKNLACRRRTSSDIKKVRNRSHNARINENPFSSTRKFIPSWAQDTAL